MKTEKEKMLAGELYVGFDEELVAERTRARRLQKQLNIDHYGEPEQQAPILRKLLPNCRNDICIEAPFHCDYGYNIHCGEKVYMNFGCVFLDVGEIRIGNRVLFAPNVQLYTAGHPLDVTQRRADLEFGQPITIGDDCWIGGGAIILPGVTLGDRVVVGAGSVVTKNVQSDTLVAGNAARIIKQTV